MYWTTSFQLFILIPFKIEYTLQFKIMHILMWDNTIVMKFSSLIVPPRANIFETKRLQDDNNCKIILLGVFKFCFSFHERLPTEENL